MPLELVKVFSRNAEKLRAFCERLSGMTGVAVVPAASADQLVAEARALKKAHGFTSHKLKGGVFPPDVCE